MGTPGRIDHDSAEFYNSFLCQLPALKGGACSFVIDRGCENIQPLSRSRYPEVFPKLQALSLVVKQSCRVGTVLPAWRARITPRTRIDTKQRKKCGKKAEDKKFFDPNTNSVELFNSHYQFLRSWNIGSILDHAFSFFARKSLSGPARRRAGTGKPYYQRCTTFSYYHTNKGTLQSNNLLAASIMSSGIKWK